MWNHRPKLFSLCPVTAGRGAGPEGSGIDFVDGDLPNFVAVDHQPGTDCPA